MPTTRELHRTARRIEKLAPKTLADDRIGLSVLRAAMVRDIYRETIEATGINPARSPRGVTNLDPL